jgi:hypothetical protein
VPASDPDNPFASFPAEVKETVGLSPTGALKVKLSAAGYLEKHAHDHPHCLVVAFVWPPAVRRSCAYFQMRPKGRHDGRFARKYGPWVSSRVGVGLIGRRHHAVQTTPSPLPAAKVGLFPLSDLFCQGVCLSVVVSSIVGVC